MFSYLTDGFAYASEALVGKFIGAKNKFDLKELDRVDSLFEQHKPDIVYHFAAYAAEGLSPFIRKFN